MAFLEVSTTVVCPMACSYCPRLAIESAYHGPRLMTFETFAAALNHCPPELAVSFAGYAEPYLNRDCSRMVDHAAMQCRRVQMYTTGVGMTDADVDVLIKVQPSPCVLHLPDAGGDMKAKVTLEYASRMSRLAMGVKGCQTVCYGGWHPLLIPLKAYQAGHGLHSRAGNVTHLPQVRKRGPLRCRISPKLDENVLLPDGNLSLCCADWSLQHPVGSLLTQTWGEIHAGEQMTEMRRVMAAGESCLCQNCEFSESA